MTHDYKRNGTVDLFAAMNVATGEVLHDTGRRHAGGDVLAFFKLIDSNVPRHLDVHVVLDNLSAHKFEPVRTWLADPNRWHLHFTPTSASWLNLPGEASPRRCRRTGEIDIKCERWATGDVATT